MNPGRAVFVLLALAAPFLAGAQRKHIDWSGLTQEERAQLGATAETGKRKKDDHKPASREVIFMFNWSGGHWVQGETVPLQYISEILFLDEACPISFAGSESMHRAWHFHDVGCWEPTVGDGYNFASSITNDIQHIRGPLEYMVHGTVQSDSSVTITELGFDSLTFVNIASHRIAERQLQQLRQMQDARP